MTEVAFMPSGADAVQCPFCEGKGAYPETPFSDSSVISNERCPVCKGLGFNVIPATSEASTVCKYCEGSGRGWDENGYFVGDPCPVCSGTGFIDISAVVAAQSSRDLPGFWNSLHPAVVKAAKTRFETGHFADAVEAALKDFNAAVKVLAPQAADLDGARLMTRVFSVDKPLYLLDSLDTETGRNIQLGYMQLFSGAMTGIRNPKAHANVVIDAQRAVHFLYLVSLFFFKLDEGQASTPTAVQ